MKVVHKDICSMVYSADSFLSSLMLEECTDGLGEMNASDLYSLGITYRDGTDRKKLNRKKAAEYFLKAAEQGKVGAMAWMALLATGTITGFKENTKLLKHWKKKLKSRNGIVFITKKASEGDTNCQYTLGVLYEEGVAVHTNFRKSVHWYRLAANNNFPPAQNNLALMIKRGLGTPQDNNEPIEWYRRAAEQNYVIAQNNLGYLLKTSRTSPDANSDALVWFQKAADSGYGSAMKNVGDMYRTGQGVEKNLSTACHFYQIAVEHHCEYAMVSLGNIYTENGTGWDHDIQKAFYWFTRATKEQIGAAHFSLYSIYSQQFIPITENLTAEMCKEKAMYHLGQSIAVKRSSIFGHCEYGKLLIEGDEFERNISKGVFHLIKATICGDSEALDMLGDIYLGKLQLLFLGVRELQPSSSTFPLLSIANDFLEPFIKDQEHNLRREFLFLGSDDISKKILLLRALSPCLSKSDLLHCIGGFYDDLMLYMEEELWNREECVQFPTMQNVLELCPFPEISVSSLIHKTLFLLYIELDENENMAVAPVLKEKELEELKLFSGDNYKENGIVAIFLDHSEVPLLVHRDVLLEDPYFNRLLNNGMAESNNNFIRIHEVSRPSMQLFIDFMYGKPIIDHIEGSSILEYIGTCRYFGWESLHGAVCSALEDMLDWQQVEEMYDYSIETNDARVSESCLQFAMKKLGEVLENKIRQPHTIPISDTFVEKIIIHMKHKFRVIKEAEPREEQIKTKQPQ